MYNEVTLCYWEYEVSGNVGVDMFKRTKGEKKPKEKPLTFCW